MAWKDSSQVAQFVRSNYSQADRERIYALYSAHSFVYGAFLRKGTTIGSPFDTAIRPSKYAEELLSQIDTSAHDSKDVSLALLYCFFHNDFLIDIRKSDPASALEYISGELLSGRLYLPHRFGRVLYDRFSEIKAANRVVHMAADDVEKLIDGTEQGNYQVGKFASGPLGILKSEEDRYLPPFLRVPLWHCSDTGCRQVHSVSLTRHTHPAYDLAQELQAVAEKQEGPPSIWDGTLSEIGCDPVPVERGYYDLIPLMADGMSLEEKQELVAACLAGSCGDAMRATLAPFKLDKGSNQTVAGKLSDGVALQLLMTVTDKHLVQLIDRSVRDRKIKVPVTEIRRPRFAPPERSGYELRSTLSIFGIRSDRGEPMAFLSSIIWNEYERAGQLAELAWRCNMGSAMPKPGEPIEYMKSHTVREAVRNLILPSRPISVAIASKLQMELISGEPDDHIIDRFLWKAGFNVPRYDIKYRRLRSQLQQLREEAIKAPARLRADDRDSLRSKGVNVFVSLENFVEELISYNIWLLSSDHFGETRFRYRFESAVAGVAKCLGASRQVGDMSFSWKSDGGNTLGTLLVYARAAADWMLQLPTSNLISPKRAVGDLPHYTRDTTRTFPFQHYHLWADADSRELKEYAEEFDSIVTQLERSRISEIRNGLDHFREDDKCPSLESIIACERRLTEVVDSADLRRFIPKSFWVTENRVEEFGKEEYILQDYDSRKIAINGPAILSGLRPIRFFQPTIIPFGNLLGASNSELVLELEEESSYSKMWNNYPRRQPYKEDDAETDSSEADDAQNVGPA